MGPFFFFFAHMVFFKFFKGKTGERRGPLFAPGVGGEGGLGCFQNIKITTQNNVSMFIKKQIVGCFFFLSILKFL